MAEDRVPGAGSGPRTGGRRVLVTAGASGIGLAMGRAFADAGWAVWVCDRDEAALADCPRDWGRTVLDIADEEAVAAMMRLIGGAGGLDAICANAGTAGPTAPVTEQPWDGWRACLDVTLGGAFLTVKHGAPLLQRGGAIVFTSSTAGLYGYPGRAPYAAAKWAIHGLMKTVAMELGPRGIRANAIAPGAVEGPRMEGVLAREAAMKGMTPDQVREGYAAGTSMRTWVRAEDIAAMALFLCSDGAARVSGQIVAVDGHTENPDPKV